MTQLRLFAVLLAAVCLGICLAQESAESGEAGTGGGLGGNQGGGNQPAGSAEENGGGDNQSGGQGQGPSGGVNSQGGGVNPLDLRGRQLQIFNARLRFVRRELQILSQAISRFLFFGQEQETVLRDELLLALEFALFPPPPPTTLPPLGPPLPTGPLV